jgi:hypothetical protein
MLQAPLQDRRENIIGIVGTSARLADGGRWGRAVIAGGPTRPLAVDGVAVLECCMGSGLLGRVGAGSKLWIKPKLP